MYKNPKALIGPFLGSTKGKADFIYPETLPGVLLVIALPVLWMNERRAVH